MAPPPLRVQIRSYCYDCQRRGRPLWPGRGHNPATPHTDQIMWQWRIMWPDGTIAKSQGWFATHARAAASVQRAYPKLLRRIRGAQPESEAE